MEHLAAETGKCWPGQDSTQANYFLLGQIRSEDKAHQTEPQFNFNVVHNAVCQDEMSVAVSAQVCRK